MFFDLAQKFQDPVKREGFADQTVRKTTHNDGWAVDGVRDPAIHHQLFGFKFALLIRVVESGGGEGPFHHASGIGSCNICGADIVKIFHFQQMSHFQSIPGPFQIGLINFPIRIFTQIDICRTMEKHIKRSLCQNLFLGEILDIAADHFDMRKNFFRSFGDSVKSTLFMNNPDDPIFRGNPFPRAAKSNKFKVVMIPKHRRNHRSSY